MLLRLRNSQKYYEKQNTFHIGANKWFLTEGKIFSASLQRLFIRLLAVFIYRDADTQCFFSKLPLFVSLFVIELKPAMVNSRISFTPKFMMPGLLIFKIFYDDNICSGYIFLKDLNLLFKICLSSVCRA